MIEDVHQPMPAAVGEKKDCDRVGCGLHAVVRTPAEESESRGGRF
jgi:hypothetical protein